MYSPAAIEKPPASKPAIPASVTIVGSPEPPATPITMLKLEISPSFTPITAARRLPPPSGPSGESARRKRGLDSASVMFGESSRWG